MKRSLSVRPGRRSLRIETLESRRVLATYLVDTFIDSADGVCGVDGIGNQQCTLRSALIAANENPGADEILLPAGSYELTIPSRGVPEAATGALDIFDGLTIRSLTTDPADVVIDGGGLDSVFRINGPIDSPDPILVRFEALTIQNGLSAQRGGGIDASRADVQIVNSVLRDNRVFGGEFALGGGAVFSDGDLLIETSLIADNQVVLGPSSFGPAAGGGVAFFGSPDSSLVIRQSSFLGNSAVSGGGVYAFGGEVAVTMVAEASTFARNVANDSGGGVAAIGSAVDFTNVTISDNFAGQSGGGILYDNFNDNLSGSIAFSTLASNATTEGQGSNVVVTELPLQFASSLIADPLAVVEPGGPQTTGVNFAASPGGVVSLSFNLDSDGSGGFDAVGDQSGVDPLLAPLADNGGPVPTRALLPESPAIDAAGELTVLVDARGVTRPLDGNGDGQPLPDIGAFEAEPPPLPVADLRIDQSLQTVAGTPIPPGTLQTGQNAIFRSTVTNDGPDVATGVTIVQTLPVDVTLVQAELDGFAPGVGITFDPATRGLTADVGTLAVDSATTLTVTVNVNADSESLITSTSVVSADPELDPDPDNDVATIEAAVIRAVDLSIQTELDPDSTPEFGGTVSYSVTVSNLATSPGDARGFSVSNVLPDGLSYIDGSFDPGASGVSLIDIGPTLTFVGVPLAVGEAVNFRFDAAVSFATNDPLVNTATVAAFDEAGVEDRDIDADNNTFVLIVDRDDTRIRHTLTTGDGEGDVTIRVDSFGRFGDDPDDPFGIQAIFNPVGPLDPASVVFESFLAIRSDVDNAFESIDPDNPSTAVLEPVSGTPLNAASGFVIGPFNVDLDQAVAASFDDAGSRIGAELTQTYRFTNTATTPLTLDLVRYLDPDILFDGSLLDGGGVLFAADGSPILFGTDIAGGPTTVTPFVGLTSSGGEALFDDRYDVDRVELLRSRLFEEDTPLRNRVSGDSNGDRFVDSGNAYDVALALREWFTVAPGQSVTYVTNTFFGTRPDSIAPPADLTGSVFCDFDGDGIATPDEAAVDALVFLDLNGNRLFEPELGEIGTRTDAAGNYSIFTAGLVDDSRARLVVVTPEGCFPAPSDIGVTRQTLTTGNLSRDVAVLANPLTGTDDILVINELGNDLVRLVNDGSGNFSLGASVPLGDRPYALSAYHDAAGAEVIAVAAVGSDESPGRLYVIEDGVVTHYPAGDGPIAVVVDDFNQDGQPDFVTAAFRDGSIMLRMGGETEARQIAQARVPRSISTADINGNSIPDLVIVASGYEGDTSSEVIVLLGDGQGGFTPLRDTIRRDAAIDVVAADYDGLPGDELVIANFSGAIDIYRFDAVSGRLEQVRSVMANRGINAVLAEDINGNGLIDLVASNPIAETVDIFIGLPDGSFADPRTIGDIVTPAALAIGNFDNAPLRQIAVANLFGSDSPYRLPSTVSVLGLTVTEREVVVATGQPLTVDFTFDAYAGTPQRALMPEEFRYDVDNNGVVTPRDALLILNEISLQRRGEGEGGSARRLTRRFKTDVNGDGQTTPLDALLVLNHISRTARVGLIDGEWGRPDDERLEAIDEVMADPARLF